jgi:C_GCAxxG_C_C family probable redox protein
MSKTDFAEECFNSGFSCSQAVLAAFCEDYGLDKKLALKMACSFGGGMSHLGEVCGAVTGALMVLGLKYGQDDEEDKHSKAVNFLLVKDFVARFRKLNGSISCKELIEYDISDEKQLTAARQTDVFQTKCASYVKNAVNLLEEIISEYEVELCEEQRKK